jgi:glucan phosphoethanolaminetransferase (alkaline phosphatase superfamily)
MLKLKKSNIVKRVKSAHFIGRQLSRLKLGQSYYAIAVSTVSAISLIFLAFEISFWMLILIFPVLLIGAFVVGYFMDIYNINTMDKLKANEIGNRYLTTSDLKSQEFQLLQTEIVLEALKAIQEEQQLDPKDLLKKYDLYFRKWKSPYK